MILNEKKLKESESRLKNCIREGMIKTKEKPEHVQFFLKNAEDSIDSAKALLELSTNPEKQKNFGFTSFNGLLWVVNASYYSMFYMVRALLENEGIKIWRMKASKSKLISQFMLSHLMQWFVIFI